MGWSINNFKIKWSIYNLVFLILYTIFMFCIIHNRNLYTEFYQEVIFEWGGYDIKIPKQINRQNMAIYFKEYYSLFGYLHYPINLFVCVYISTSILYVFLNVLLLLKIKFKIKYVIFTDAVTFLILSIFFGAIYLYGAPNAGYFSFWFDSVLISVLIFFRLFQWGILIKRYRYINSKNQIKLNK
jgi:hypothetical protein